MRFTVSAGLLIGPITAVAQEFRVEIRKTVQYGTHDGTTLIGFYNIYLRVRRKGPQCTHCGPCCET